MGLEGNQTSCFAQDFERWAKDVKGLAWHQVVDDEEFCSNPSSLRDEAAGSNAGNPPFRSPLQQPLRLPITTRDAKGSQEIEYPFNSVTPEMIPSGANTPSPVNCWSAISREASCMTDLGLPAAEKSTGLPTNQNDSPIGDDADTTSSGLSTPSSVGSKRRMPLDLSSMLGLPADERTQSVEAPSRGQDNAVHRTASTGSLQMGYVVSWNSAWNPTPSWCGVGGLDSEMQRRISDGAPSMNRRVSDSQVMYSPQQGRRVSDSQVVYSPQQNDAFMPALFPAGQVVGHMGRCPPNINHRSSEGILRRPEILITPTQGSITAPSVPPSPGAWQTMHRSSSEGTPRPQQMPGPILAQPPSVQRRRNSENTQRRVVEGKDRRWWTKDEGCCPVSGFPIALLPYPPVKLSIRGLPVLVDGNYLVLLTLSTSTFTVLGEPLTKGQVATLDEYTRRCKLGSFRLQDAFDLEGQNSDFARQQLQALRSQAQHKLQALQKLQSLRLESHRKTVQSQLENQVEITPSVFGGTRKVSNMASSSVETTDVFGGNVLFSSMASNSVETAGSPDPSSMVLVSVPSTGLAQSCRSGWSTPSSFGQVPTAEELRERLASIEMPFSSRDGAPRSSTPEFTSPRSIAADGNLVYRMTEPVLAIKPAQQSRTASVESRQGGTPPSIASPPRMGNKNRKKLGSPGSKMMSPIVVPTSPPRANTPETPASYSHGKSSSPTKQFAQDSQGRWWTRLSDICPVSGFPVGLLPYPPVKLQIGTRTRLIDGSYLVLQMLSSWRFDVLGEPLSTSQIQALDAYVKRCKLGPFRLGHAMELEGQVDEDSRKQLLAMRHRASHRLQVLQNVQQARLQRGDAEEQQRHQLQIQMESPHSPQPTQRSTGFRKSPLSGR